MVLGNFVSGGPEYTISNITYAGQLINGSDNITTSNTPGQLVWKPDGTAFYYGMTTGFSELLNVRQFSVGTNWDLTTASFVGISPDLFARAHALAFKDDGTKLYVAGFGNKSTVYQYSLSTAWDVSTATYDSKSFAWASEPGSFFYPRSFFFIDNGSTLLTSNRGSSHFPTNIARYSLATAWDISTASYSSSSAFPIKSGSSNYYGGGGFAFSPNGKKVVLTAAFTALQGYSGETGSRFFSADLTTAYDLSTATNIQTAAIFSSNGLPVVDSTSSLEEKNGACCWNDDGTRLYVTKQWNDQGGTTPVGRILQFDIS
jgi:hypothetical protein